MTDITQETSTINGAGAQAQALPADKTQTLDSRDLAKALGRRHANVLMSIRKLIGRTSGGGAPTEGFTAVPDVQRGLTSHYLMTREAARAYARGDRAIRNLVEILVNDRHLEEKTSGHHDTEITAHESNEPSALTIPGYDLPMYEFDGELYCKDVDLGRAIGLAEPTHIRKTISRNIKALEELANVRRMRRTFSSGNGTLREVEVTYLNHEQATMLTALSRTAKGTKLIVLMTRVYVAWANGKLTGPAEEPAPVLSLEDMSDTEILDRQVRRSIAGLANAYLGSRRPGAIDSGLAYKIGHDGFTAASDPETGALEVIVADEHGRPALRIGSEPNPVDPTRTVLIADGLQLARFLKVDVGALMARLCDLQRETGDYTMDHVAFDVSTFTVSHEAYQATLSSDPSIDAFRRLRVTEGFARMQREREARHSASDELALRLAKATAAIGDAERILKKVRGTAWQSKARLEFDTEAVFRGHLEDLEAEAGRLKGDTTRYLAAVATVTERLAGAAAPAYAALLADALRGNSDDVPASAVIRVVLEAGRDPQNYVEIDDADHGPADRSAFAAGSVRILSTCLADRLGSTGEAPEPPRGP